MIKHMHTHPVVTTASSTTKRPKRAPRASIGALFVSAVSGDRSPDSTDGMGIVTWKAPPAEFVQDGMTVVVIVVCVHWLGVTT